MSNKIETFFYYNEIKYHLVAQRSDPDSIWKVTSPDFPEELVSITSDANFIIPSFKEMLKDSYEPRLKSFDFLFSISPDSSLRGMLTSQVETIKSTVFRMPTKQEIHKFERDHHCDVVGIFPLHTRN